MVKVITRNQSKVAVTRFFSRHDFCPHVIYLVYIETQNFGGWELKIDKMHRTEAHGTQHTRHSSSSSTAVAASPQRSMAAAGDAPYPGRRIPEIPPQWKYLTRYVLHKSLFSRKNECHFGRNWSNTHSWYRSSTRKISMMISHCSRSFSWNLARGHKIGYKKRLDGRKQTKGFKW